MLLDSDKREAMTLRIFVNGISSYSPSEAIAGLAAGAAPFFDATEAANDSTSALTMRPRGPVPSIAPKSSPFSPAIFFAIGLAKMRPIQAR